MKVSTALSLVGFALGTIAFTAAPGCSSDETTTSTGGDQAGRVPPKPTGSAVSGGEERTYALHTLYLGETDRGGAKNGDAWKDYGYNLDGLVTKVTDAKSPDLEKVCKRVGAAEASVHADGNEGIDNAFGNKILELLEPFAPTPSKPVNEAIQRGDFTILLKVKGLTDDPAQTNTGLSGTILVGAAYGETPPTFTKSDDWPYRANPQVPINGAYIENGQFVNGEGGASIQLSLKVQGQTLTLTVQKAIITFKHGANDELVDGTIAGVLSTEELINGVSAIAGSFSTDLCEGATIEGIKDSIRQASDMMADGSQSPGATCSGISVGIGFTAKRVGNPTKTAPEGAIETDPCDAPAGGGDAGTDAQ
jgi:hypothetical protein